MGTLLDGPVDAARVETQRRVQPDLTLRGEGQEEAARVEAPPVLKARMALADF
jgi:hypothetical protein